MGSDFRKFPFIGENSRNNRLIKESTGKVQSDLAIKSAAHSLKSFADILSKPVDFDLHDLDKSRRTLGTLVGFSSNVQ